jgi:catechol-2,3-dioxygenase
VRPSVDASSLADRPTTQVQVQALGHVVLKVRNLQRSEAFYSDTLGMPVTLRLSDPRMTFFALETSGNHHDFALIEVGSGSALSPADNPTGLAHVAFKVGSSLEEFGQLRSVLEASGITVLYEAERGFSRSVHVLDPDENEIELYVDIRDL